MCLVKAIVNLRKMPMVRIVVVWKLVAECHDDPCTQRKSFSRNLLTYLLTYSLTYLLSQSPFAVKCGNSELFQMSISMHVNIFIMS